MWVVRVALAVALNPNDAHAAPSREYQVKAVFLFNFAQFVEWPPASFANAGDPIVVGVLGNDPFGSMLDEAVRGEEAQGRRIVVRRFNDVEAASHAQILFISSKEASRLPQILAALDHKPVLTVGESEGFAVSGGMIRFTMDRGRIRLRINVDVARRANLRLSSKLLRPAEIVESGEPGP
jgi:hypothetical protein